MNTMISLLKREYWENRGSFAITPIAIGGFFVISLIFALFGSQVFSFNDDGSSSAIRVTGVEISGFDFFVDMTKEFAAIPLEGRIEIWTMAFYGLSGLFILTMVFVSLFYLLGALYDDRRDRSILFWKSLPVSDFTTVSSKVLAVFLVLPVLFTIAMTVTFFTIMLIGSIVAMFSGGDVWASIWQPAPILSAPLKILTGHWIHTLWASPVLGWILFVSSWTKRKPILVATIPVGAIAFLEFYYNRTVHFGSAVWERLSGWVLPIDLTEGSHLGNGEMINQTWDLYAMAPSLMSLTEFWVGLIVAAGFFAGAVIVRRYRDESF